MKKGMFTCLQIHVQTSTFTDTDTDTDTDTKAYTQQSRSQSLLTSYGACSTKNEGLWKGPVLIVRK